MRFLLRLVVLALAAIGAKALYDKIAPHREELGRTGADIVDRTTSAARDVVDRTSSAARDIADSASSAAHDVADRASSTAHDVADQVTEATERVGSSSPAPEGANSSV